MEVSGQLHGPFTLPQGNSPRQHLIGSVGSRVGLDAVAKRKIPSSCRDSKSGRTARSLVTILTKVSRLPKFVY